MSYDAEEVVFGCLFITLVGGFVLFVGAIVFDGVQAQRAFDGKMACAARRMEPNRQAFTTHVVCTPINTRQDTSTVQVKVQP
jgi:hypothetical protein